MDPAYSGQELPVQTIEFSYTIRDELPVEEGIVEVVADCGIMVLVAPGNGWYADTRLIFTLVRGTDGFYRIRSIHEVPILAPRASAEESNESVTWGDIKNGYR